jgi:hypothetical protein
VGGEPGEDVLLRLADLGALAEGAGEAKQGYASIAHARRYYDRDDQRILALYGYTLNPTPGT